MRLSDLLRRVDYRRIIGNESVEVNDVCADSRKLKSGGMFVCLKGKVDGKTFAESAAVRAAVIMTDEELPLDVTQVIVRNVRASYARAVAALYDNPQDKLKIIGVVGTNGKTSCCYLLNSIFRLSGCKTGMLTTVECDVDGVKSPASLTTPDPDVLYKLLSEMVEKKVEYVFMELSAHGIYYEKLSGLRTKATIFTNCTRDHLDFFKDFDSYAAVKKSWFSISNTNLAVVNYDDKIGREILQECNCPYLTYGVDNPGDVFAIDLTHNKNGTSFIINMFDIVKRVNSGFYGKFNVYNMLAACTVAGYFGIAMSNIAAVLENGRKIPGRFNVYHTRGGSRVVIDYAHTGDGLENVLSTAREITKGRLITVFGCGGDRDSGKRKTMGEIAARLSDYVVITNDNPRTENPYEIARAVEAGVICGDINYEVILDRKDAITEAIQFAEPEDTVVITGKGAEAYIEINGKKIPYSDYQTVKELNGGSL